MPRTVVALTSTTDSSNHKSASIRDVLAEIGSRRAQCLSQALAESVCVAVSEDVLPTDVAGFCEHATLSELLILNFLSCSGCVVNCKLKDGEFETHADFIPTPFSRSLFSDLHASFSHTDVDSELDRIFSANVQIDTGAGV